MKSRSLLELQKAKKTKKTSPENRWNFPPELNKIVVRKNMKHVKMKKSNFVNAKLIFSAFRRLIIFLRLEVKKIFMEFVQIKNNYVSFGLCFDWFLG